MQQVIDQAVQIVRGSENLAQAEQRAFVRASAGLALQLLGVAGDAAQWCFQVVRDSAGEILEFVVARPKHFLGLLEPLGVELQFSMERDNAGIGFSQFAIDARHVLVALAQQSDDGEQLLVLRADFFQRRIGAGRGQRFRDVPQHGRRDRRSGGRE